MSANLLQNQKLHELVTGEGNGNGERERGKRRGSDVNVEEKEKYNTKEKRKQQFDSWSGRNVPSVLLSHQNDIKFWQHKMPPTFKSNWYVLYIEWLIFSNHSLAAEENILIPYGFVGTYTHTHSIVVGCSMLRSYLTLKSRGRPSVMVIRFCVTNVKYFRYFHIHKSDEYQRERERKKETRWVMQRNRQLLSSTKHPTFMFATHSIFAQISQNASIINIKCFAHYLMTISILAKVKWNVTRVKKSHYFTQRLI